MHKILVIEDEQPVRSNILKILGFEKLEAISAEDGTAGLAAAKEHLPDLIVCDIMMPGLDGYEVRNALFQSPETAMIPFIFLTAKADKVDVRLGMNLGADDYLTKPFTRDELLEAVFVRLDKQSARQRQLQEKMDRFRGHITTSLPTDLLMPLNQIQSFLKTLLNTETLEKPVDLSNVQEAYAASLHLERQLQNFLLYALLETTVQNSEKAEALRGHCTTQSKSILAETAQEIAKQYGRETDLKLDLEESKISILEANLVKIAEELIDNAFKFSSLGTTVLVKGSVTQNQFILDIFDQGAGLTQVQISELGAYVRFGAKINSRGGAGLGLSIAKCLIELHEGQLSIESLPATWTTVRVILPCTTSLATPNFSDLSEKSS
jgi:two-component system, sensor histidine kinase and response regulator